MRQTPTCVETGQASFISFAIYSRVSSKQDRHVLCLSIFACWIQRGQTPTHRFPLCAQRTPCLGNMHGVGVSHRSLLLSIHVSLKRDKHVSLLETGQACLSACWIGWGQSWRGADPDMLLNATGSDPDMSSARNRTGMFLCLLDPAGSDPDMLIPLCTQERRFRQHAVALGSDTVRHCYLFTSARNGTGMFICLLDPVGSESAGVRPRHATGSDPDMLFLHVSSKQDRHLSLLFEVTGSDSVHSVGVRHRSSLIAIHAYCENGTGIFLSWAVGAGSDTERAMVWGSEAGWWRRCGGRVVWVGEGMIAVRPMQ